jgi:hypothetical protein
MSCVLDQRRLEDAYAEYEAKQRRQVLEDEEIQQQTRHLKELFQKLRGPRTARTPKGCTDCGGIIPAGAKYTRHTFAIGNPLDGYKHTKYYAHYPACPTEGSQ